MFNKLPQEIQSQVIQHLEKDNFTKAKFIYDQWILQQRSPQPGRKCNQTNS